MLRVNQSSKASIMEKIRDKYGTISAFARHNKVRREVVYQSLEGHGSRAMRLAIAELMQSKPSHLWNDGSLARLKDDKDYEERR